MNAVTAQVDATATGRHGSVSWRPVGVFFALALGLAWLVDLPLWLSGAGLRTPHALMIITTSMFAPMAAALLVVRLIHRIRGRAVLHRLGWWPLRPLRRTILLAVFGLLGCSLLPLLTTLLAGAFGLVRLDLRHFSGFAATLAAKLPPGEAPSVPIQALVAVQLASIPVGGLVNGLLTVGEETGWRGYLLPALRPLGTWPALLLSGMLWGLWHAPVILLGYDFDRPDALGLGMMVVGCVLLGVIVGWLRIRSASIWPSVVAHGAFNAGAGVLGLLGAAGARPDPAAVGALGMVAWIVLGSVVVVLLIIRVVPDRTRWAEPVPTRNQDPRTVDR